MVTFLIILLIILCIGISIFVLIQNPKGGGLVTGGGSTNMFGVQRTGDVLEKGTWVLMAAIVVISLTITTLSMGGGQKAGANSAIQERLDKTPSPSPIGGALQQQAAPAPAPTGDSTKK
ncbi:MAG: preprotein translocase subunit SecG [Pedobacter sp.]|nr:preprotein translocase subunit SecG [Pedobacter sp.]